MDLNFLWPLLGGAVGAAIVNSAFGFFKHGREAALEQEQWRRNQRQTGYTDFLRALAEFESAMGRTRDFVIEGEESAKAISDTINAYYLANSGLHMLAPPRLIVASSEIKTRTDECMKALLWVMREGESEAEDAWDTASRALTRATTDFVILARHDLGMLEDNRDKTRAALQNELLKYRSSGLLSRR
ncbi:hypothetical protein SAMN04487916_11756 [Arthrobacter sp. ov407]|uniref:hypothetical protein n=1 Tax=Arthrobacter sp. ov407 TaxID=1761748 RepID=UPI00087E0F36|nr:hypothetical protein [Arthrobacter sp. ov407]SDL90378.1 hypothetical protein SAMN04487916_11756 [Arthrobacter sp. ov407]